MVDGVTGIESTILKSIMETDAHNLLTIKLTIMTKEAKLVSHEETPSVFDTIRTVEFEGDIYEYSETHYHKNVADVRSYEELTKNRVEIRYDDLPDEVEDLLFNY